ncbi:MAG: hypothetical protein KKA36_04080 [Gammaproteobacteria bacterium]|nr:hypothetical protein [Gammaproteobacteria bacterium]
MAECSIHYVEQAWDNYDSSLDVWVNLTDLHLGKGRIESQDAFAPNLEGRDITAQLSDADRRTLFNAMRRVQLGYVAEPLMGCDGSDHDLTLRFSSTCSITCHWWTELPAEWKGVKEIVRILRRYARAVSDSPS